MKWVTRDMVHLERVATPWLIRRFVDPQAEFLFITWDPAAERPADAIPFAIPGEEISNHDQDGTAFRKTMTKYKITDPAVESIEQLVAAAVKIIMHDYKPGADDRHAQMATGLIALSEGVMLMEAGDAEVIEASLPIYDALYAYFTAEHMRKAPRAEDAASDRAMQQTVYVHSLAKFRRALRKTA